MTVEEIGTRMDALDIWRVSMPCHWAVKPHGCAFPYFCCTMPGGAPAVKVRFLLLEGWQTFHDFVRTRVDRDFGFYSSAVEFPQYELAILQDGTVRFFRHDPGYVPCEVGAQARALCARMLWEAYGVLLRLEADNRLPLKFADDKAVFARVEDAQGVWHDEPIEIPRPRPQVEKVAFAKTAIAAAKDVPLKTEETLELDLRMVPQVMTREKRPRFLYVLAGVDTQTGAAVFCDKLSVDAESGLRGLWEGMPPRVLDHLVERHAVPGEVRVLSGRVFRMLRPLCLELPFKLSKVASLPRLDAALRSLRY